jgi:hypothetical protein
MRTIRTLVLLVACLVMLPFSVMLRSAGADINVIDVCENTGDWNRAVAEERDKGLTILGALERARQLLLSDQISPLDYIGIVGIIQNVYTHTKMTPQQLNKMSQDKCLKANGVSQI